MGLDMYLNKHNYVQNWNHMEDKEKHTIVVKKGGVVRDDIKPERINYIIEQIAYWRKANHIHKWFVDNCQDGKDDCREAYVSVDQLRELVDLCKQVKKSLNDSPTNTKIAEKLLPSVSGFFFGTTEYDEWYIQSLDETIQQLSDLDENGDYYYQSSW